LIELRIKLLPCSLLMHHKLRDSISGRSQEFSE
jgi:hypothetical protein